MSCRKSIVGLGASLALGVSFLFAPAFAQAADDSDSVGNFGMSGRILEEPAITTTWVHDGDHIQYPYQGGIWRYGRWNGKYRSYYKVNRCHGSTVILGSKSFRTVDTASGRWSSAEISAWNSPGADPHYYYRVC